MIKKSKKSKITWNNQFVLLTVLIVLLVILINKPINLFSASSDLSQASPSASINHEQTVYPKIPANFGKSVSVPIIYYHYIGNNPNPADKARDGLSIAPDKFEEELEYLSKANFTPISLDTMIAALKGNTSLPNKPIILSFDDGYIDFYVNAFPLLRKFNFHSVQFIPTGLVGKSSYLTWDQIKEMDSTGLVSFQAHSVTHANLPSLSDTQLKYEIIQSKKDLEEKLGKPVNFFAYPYGASDERVWNAVKSAGFFGAVGTWGGRIESEGNIFDMPRMRVGNWSLAEYQSRLGL